MSFNSIMTITLEAKEPIVIKDLGEIFTFSHYTFIYIQFIKCYRIKKIFEKIASDTTINLDFDLINELDSALSREYNTIFYSSNESIDTGSPYTVPEYLHMIAEARYKLDILRLLMNKKISVVDFVKSINNSHLTFREEYILENPNNWFLGKQCDIYQQEEI